MDQRKKRVRTGCLQCRRRHRRCDETHPVCRMCESKRIECKWPPRINVFINSFISSGQRTDISSILNSGSHILRASRYSDCGVLSSGSSNNSFDVRRRHSSPVTNDSENVAVAVLNDLIRADDDSNSSEIVTTPIENQLSLISSRISLAKHNQDVNFSPNISSNISSNVVQLYTSPSPVSSVSTTASPGTVTGYEKSPISAAANSQRYLHLYDNFLDYMRENAASSRVQDTSINKLINRASSDASWDVSKEDQVKLLQNYIDEVGPWLDMFDLSRHFTLKLPTILRDSSPLLYSVLALSSRQMELVNPEYFAETTFRLYEKALHLVAPTVQQPTDIYIVASCVILCVFEMVITSSKDWRSHLQGCATLFKSAGINGFKGFDGPSESLFIALFWCFARMDTLYAVIGGAPTVSPCTDWFPEGVSIYEVKPLFLKGHGCDMYANYVVFLCARVVNLLTGINDDDFDHEWEILWQELEGWCADRPKEMLPIFTYQSEKSLFPQVLYSNSPATSGNQMYHMAHILMVENKPRRYKLGQDVKSAIWHAKQICGISLSNSDHGCWNNALQPIWVAGKLMSSKKEHEIIVNLLKKINTETGWATDWRIRDLESFWSTSD